MKSKIIIFILWLLSWLPLPIVHGFAFILGLCIYWFPNHLKKIAYKNIKLCFPELSNHKQQQLLRNSLIENSKTALEMGIMWFASDKRLQRLKKGHKGLDIWQKAYQKGKGVILVMPHLGQWEFVGLFSLGPMTSLYRPPKLAGFGEFLLNARMRTGNTLVPTSTSGVKALLKNLKKGELACILPDQDPGTGGIFVPFFGIQTNTMNLVGKLAQRTAAEVIFTYAERLSWGRGYIIHIHACDNKDIAHSDLVKSATALNQQIESCIYKLPAQYQWTYKRFKKRPDGEEKFY